MSAAGVRAWWAHYWPAGDGFDLQDRKIWAWHMEPSNSAPPDDFGTTFQQRQNVARSRWRIVPNGSFDEQDRNHWAGFIQPGNSTAIHLQTFSVTYTLTPTFSNASAFSGVIDSVLNSVSSSLASVGFNSFIPDFTITNDNATKDNPVNYIIDDRTGFKLHLEKKRGFDGYGLYVDNKRADPKHPQDQQGSRNNKKQPGPRNAEGPDHSGECSTREFIP